MLGYDISDDDFHGRCVRPDRRMDVRMGWRGVFPPLLEHWQRVGSCTKFGVYYNINTANNNYNEYDQHHNHAGSLLQPGTEPDSNSK
jgi:hypothetical protein